MTVRQIMNTVGFAVIILGLFFVLIASFFRNEKFQQSAWLVLIHQLALILSIAGFALLIIAEWVT